VESGILQSFPNGGSSNDAAEALRVKNQSVREKSDVLNQPTNHQKRAGSAVSLPSTSCLELQWMPECIVLAATALCLAVTLDDQKKHHFLLFAN
jgi:hypothetical protein